MEGTRPPFLFPLGGAGRPNFPNFRTGPGGLLGKYANTGNRPGMTLVSADDPFSPWYSLRTFAGH